MDVTSQTLISLIAVVTAVSVVAAIGIWIVIRYRESSKDPFDSLLESQKGFEEMRFEGEISEDEYRKIKASIARDINASSPDQPSRGSIAAD